ncbi:MAG TPA: dipeptidase [Gemmatimonadota bacterium]|nr:dipeptidase [Gemmatimonadota bacterium]
MYGGLPVLDGHMDTPLRLVDEGVDIGTRLADGHADLVRLEEGGVDAVFMAAWIDPAIPAGQRMARAERLLGAIRGVAVAHPDRAAFVTDAAGVRQATLKGRIALLAGVENAEALDGDIGNAARLHALGARYLTLTWMNSNAFADAAGGERLHGGLSALGRRLIEELDALGILVDLSHASVATFGDVLARAERPPIVSHSASEVLGAHPRNLSDLQLRALAERDGVVGVNFFPGYLAPGTGTCDWTAIVDHLERAIQVAGPAHVALGSDLDGIPRLPAGFAGAQDFPRLAAELERRGIEGDDLAAVLGGNWLRVVEDLDGSGSC